MRKGIISLQFNWIFVLVAGSLILIGTVAFILMNKDVNEKVDYTKALSNIKTYIMGVYSSTGKSLNPLRLNGLEMKYRESQLSIGGASTQEYMLFAPNYIKGNSLLIWSKDFAVPYLITNVAYMTTPQVRYVMVYDDSPQSQHMLKVLNSSLDNRTFRSFIKYSNLNSLQDYNNYYTVIAFLNTPLDMNLPNFQGEKYGVELKYDENNVTGTVNFYSYNEHRKEGDSVFFGDSMMLGAVVSGDYLVYNFNIKQMFKRASAISAILEEKAKSLSTTASDQSIKEWYGNAAQMLNELSSMFESLSNNPKQLTIVKGKLMEDINTLAIQNKKLFIKSSPEIY